MGTKLKKLFAVLVVAAIAFVSLSAFTTSSSATITCEGPLLKPCTITLPDGTKIESSGDARVIQN